MKRCEKDALREFNDICKKYNISKIDCYKQFAIIDKNASQVNNDIAKLRALVKKLLKTYKYWNIGLEIELSGGYE